MDNKDDSGLAPRDHNVAADDARDVTSRLTEDYRSLLLRVDQEIEEARKLPLEVTDELEHEKLTSFVVTLRDTKKLMDSTYAAESGPFYRRWQAVGGVFNKRIETLENAIRELRRRVTVYQTRKAAAEQARRDREEADRRAEAAAKAAAEAEAAKVAEEARLAAERARAPAQIEKKAEIANRAEAVADEARVDTMIATQQAQTAAVAAAAKPADMARTRFDEGRISTLKLVGFVAIEDRTKLNKELLWPHLKEEHILMALRQWAKGNDYKTAMDGAVVEKRPDSDIR